MKKLLVSVIAIFMCLCLLGCEKEKEAENLTEVDSPAIKSGGWTVNTEVVSAGISKDAKAALDKALEEYDGMTFEPVALLGTQVVAGTNYMILCKGTTVTQTPVTSLKVVVVYKDLKGNAIISKVSDFDLEKYVSKDIAYPTDEVVGGWTVNTEFENANLPTDASTAFKGVQLTGASYTPVVLLGSQVVAGTNYAILAVGKTTTQTPITTLDVLTIYKDLEGKSKLTSIAYIDLAEFNK